MIPALYQLGMLLLADRRAALIGAALAAVSPFQLLYSHELRMYTLVMLLVTLQTAAYWQARQTRQRRWWAAFGLLALAAVYTHLFAFFVLAGIGLHALWRHEARPALWRTSVVIALTALLFLPWLNLMLGEAAQELGSLRPLTQQLPRDILLPLTTPAFLLFGQSFNAAYTGLMLFAVVATGAVFLLDWRKIRRQGISDGVLLLALLAGTTLGLPLVIYLVRPFFLPARTMAAAAPFLLLLLGWLATRRRSPLPYLVGLSALLMIAGVLLYHTGPPVKPPYRAVSAFVDERLQPGDRVLHTSDGSYLPALCYADWEEHGLLAGDPDPRKPEEVYAAVGGEVWSAAELAGGDGRLWVIVAREHSIPWQNEQLAALQAQFPLTRQTAIGGIEIYLADTITP